MKRAAPPSVVGTGLIVLDLTLLQDSDASAHRVWTGGTCGNVLAILSFLGWKAHALGRIGTDSAGTCLLRDLRDSGVEPGLMREATGTPIILHRVRVTKQGVRHSYGFECPQCDQRYPSYRPITIDQSEDQIDSAKKASVFFFDRVSRGILDMAAAARNGGAIIYFEPSAAGDEGQFIEAYQTSDVVKYASNRRPKFEGWLKKAARKRRPSLEIETQGSEGLAFRLSDDSRWRSRTALDVENVRDTSGAGDWLTAGLLFAANRMGPMTGALRDLDKVQEALHLGEALAAFNCQFEGPRGAMYASDVEFSTSMLGDVEAQTRRKLTSKTKRPALQMTLTGVCSKCVAKGRSAAQGRTV